MEVVLFMKDINWAVIGVGVIANEMANALKKSSEEIVSSVSGITETIGQAAIAVNDVAEKTMQVVTLSDDVMKVVNVTNEDSATLSKIADKFIL